MPLELTPEQNYVIVEINALPAYGSVALGVAEVGSEKGVLPGSCRMYACTSDESPRVRYLQ